MFDGAVEDLALAGFDALASLALGAVHASARERRDRQAELVEVRVEVLAVAPFHRRVRDALAFAAAVAGFAWDVLLVVVVAGF